MWFISHQIAKKMQEDGFPTVVLEIYRSAERQQRFFDEGTSKAGPWYSAHQYGEAADIVHAGLGWNAPKEYWQKLAQTTGFVAEKYGVEIVRGFDWGWDSAHIEFADWKKTPYYEAKRRPTDLEVAERLEHLFGWRDEVVRLRDFEEQREDAGLISDRTWRSTLCRYPGLIQGRFFNWIK